MIQHHQNQWPNHSQGPTSFGMIRSAVAIPVASRWQQSSRKAPIHAMKKIMLIGLLAAIIIACVLLFQHHVKITKARDEVFRERLAGVWLREDQKLPQGAGNPLIMRLTNTVAADGRFVELSWFSHPNRTNTNRRTGTWVVKNGRLIQTVKSSTNPTEVTPWSGVGKIICLDSGEFTVRWRLDETWKRVVP